jgi:hypothetical protein
MSTAKTDAPGRGTTGRVAGAEWPLDKGCAFWPACTTCIYRTCVKELPPAERAALAQAWRVLRQHIAIETIGVS